MELVVQGISYEEALGNFWVLNADGLITIKRPTALNHTVKSFARKTQEDVEGETLVETVRRVCDVSEEPAMPASCLSVFHSSLRSKATSAIILQKLSKLVQPVIRC